jgi:outer membrane protein TolC
MHAGTKALTLVACLVFHPAHLRAQEPQGGKASADTLVVSEGYLIREAMQWNLNYLSQTLDSRMAEMDVRAARSIFDPRFQSGPQFARTDGDLAGSDGSTSPFQMDVGTFNASLGGSLATSTRYDLSAETQVRNGDPALAGALDRAFNNSLTLSLTQPLLRGFGPAIAQAGVREAEDRREAALLRMDRAAAETMAQISSLFWTLDAAEAAEQARRGSLERAQDLLRRQQELSRLGRVAPADLLTAELGVAQREADLISATQERMDAMERLVFAVYGRDAPRRVREGLEMRTDTVQLTWPEPADLEAAQQRALDLRADVQAVRMEHEASREQLRLASNIRLPQMDLSAGYTLRADDAKSPGLSQGDISSALGSSASRGWQAGLKLSWPLGNRQATAEHEQAKAGVAQVALAVTLSENQALLDVREAVRALDANRARWEKALEGADLADQQYRNELKLLDLNRSDPFRLLQMETQLAEAELAALQAGLGLARAATAYELAVGSLATRYFPEGRSGWYHPGG